ncbi:PASTA domain-containing protein [Nocardioides sp. SYSU DS0651]|uniref:PASTA domain-containing protein n=1 Tax=Nocardioides sp. SYSU DS0651 TaxID=3415955 RepID=UPI003F4BF8B3
MRTRRAVRTLATLATIAALLVGCGGGEEEDSAKAGDGQERSAVAQSENADPVEASMPDLTGLTEDEARAELIGLGVDEGDIVVTTQESLLTAGTVVDTVPGTGNTITGSITLNIAGPVGPVPDFAGKQVAEVESWATERGIAFEEVPVADGEHADGEVLGTTPDAGQTPTSEIQVRVARTPSTKALYLTEDLGDGYCGAESGETFIDGDPYDGSYTQPDGENCVFEFDLGRDWDRLTGIVGFTDTSDSGTRMRIQVVVDGTSKVNQVIDFGKKPLELDVDVSDGLRLAIELSDVAGYGTVGFGDLRLLGTGSAAGEGQGTAEGLGEDSEDGLE